jgi:predicted metal-binding protein
LWPEMEIHGLFNLIFPSNLVHDCLASTSSKFAQLVQLALLSCLGCSTMALRTCISPMACTHASALHLVPCTFHTAPASGHRAFPQLVPAPTLACLRAAASTCRRHQTTAPIDPIYSTCCAPRDDEKNLDETEESKQVTAGI